uniref:GATA-1 zinc finger protein n=1 Tax=Solanum tuberosum TaxID=4113 RepID=M1C952_SOLTU
MESAFLDMQKAPSLPNSPSNFVTKINMVEQNYMDGISMGHVVDEDFESILNGLDFSMQNLEADVLEEDWDATVYGELFGPIPSETLMSLPLDIANSCLEDRLIGGTGVIVKDRSWAGRIVKDRGGTDVIVKDRSWAGRIVKDRGGTGLIVKDRNWAGVIVKDRGGTGLIVKDRGGLGRIVKDRSWAGRIVKDRGGTDVIVKDRKVARV